MKTLTEVEMWEKHSTPKQIKIRDKIEQESKELNMPPSCREQELIEEGILQEDWDFNPMR